MILDTHDRITNALRPFFGRVYTLHNKGSAIATDNSHSSARFLLFFKETLPLLYHAPFTCNKYVEAVCIVITVIRVGFGTVIGE